MQPLLGASARREREPPAVAQLGGKPADTLRSSHPKKKKMLFFFFFLVTRENTVRLPC